MYDVLAAIREKMVEPRRFVFFRRFVHVCHTHRDMVVGIHREEQRVIPYGSGRDECAQPRKNLVKHVLLLLQRCVE